MFNKFFDDEYKAYITYLRDCGNCKADIDILPKEEAMSLWGKNKETLFKLLGEQLIISKPYDFYDPNEVKRKDVIQLFETHEFPKYFTEALDALVASGKFPGYPAGRLKHSVQCSTCLMANSYIYEDFSFVNPKNQRIIRIATNTKLMRIYRQIIEAFDLNFDLYEDFRIKISQINNAANIKGNLTLSIHPLDFATMSDNSNNWSSCMSWSKNGDYRAGTLEMLNSPYIICAYINSIAPYWLNSSDSWNSKKWRMLFIVDKDVIMGIKSYPFHSEEIEKDVATWIKELAETNLGWKYQNDYKDISIGLGLTDFSTTTQYMYNDLMQCYNQKTAYVSETYIGKKLDLSPAIQCNCCGKINNITSNLFSEVYDIVCEDCHAPVVYCTCCESKIRYEDDIVKLPDGDIICRCCYEDNYQTCDKCGKVHDCDDIQHIEIYVNGSYHSELWVCEECYEKIKSNLI